MSETKTRAAKPMQHRDRNVTPTKRTNAERTKRAAFYGRYSVERDGKLSDAKQVAEGKARAAAKGYDLPPSAIYVDKGKSAGEGKRRPEWERLRDDIAAGRYDVLIVSKLDRFSRSTKDFAEVWAELQEAGVELISISEDFDTTTAMGRAMQQIVITFAELERAFTVERNTGIAKFRRDSERVGGLAPYGYRRVKDAHTNAAGDLVDGFVIEPAEADVVRDVIVRIIGGESLRSIARSMNEAGVPVSQHARRADWIYTTVRQTVCAPAVAGWRNDPALPDEYVRAPWEPIVSDELWRKMLDALRDSPRTTFSKTTGTTGTTQTANLLSGILTCGRCGTPMSPYRTSKGVMRYRCSRTVNPAACLGLTVAAAPAEQHVLDELFAAFRKGGRKLAPVVLRDDDRAAEIERERDELLALYEDRSKRISPAEYVRMRAALDGELEQIERAANSERRDSAIVKLISKGGDIETMWNAVDDDGEPVVPMSTKRAVLREAFRITCADNGGKGVRVPIALRVLCEEHRDDDERAA